MELWELRRISGMNFEVPLKKPRVFLGPFVGPPISQFRARGVGLTILLLTLPKLLVVHMLIWVKNIVPGTANISQAQVQRSSPSQMFG